MLKIDDSIKSLTYNNFGKHKYLKVRMSNFNRIQRLTPVIPALLAHNHFHQQLVNAIVMTKIRFNFVALDNYKYPYNIMNEIDVLKAIKNLENKIDKLISPEAKEYYTVREVESLLGISRSTFDRFRNSGKIKTTKVGRQIRVHRSIVTSIQENGF